MASEASEAVATDLLARIEEATIRLRQFPLSGAAREELAAGLRVVIEGKYAVYYVINGTEVILVRALHGARDAAALAARGGFSGV